MGVGGNWPRYFGTCIRNKGLLTPYDATASLYHNKSVVGELGLIHTCDLLGVNYCVNFLVHAIGKNGYITHY